MRVVFFQVGKEPEVREIDEGLLGMRELIKTPGHDDPTLQFIQLPKVKSLRQMVLICDDNGRVYGEPLPPNRLLGPDMDILGPFYITAVDLVGDPPDQETDNVSLSEKEIQFVLAAGKRWPMMGGHRGRT